MNKGFLIIGGIIFAVYIYLTFWNIYISHKTQKKNNYPELEKKEIFEAYDKANKEDSSK
ncbi:hypothetical protein [Psychroserpens sp. Hel_I_66]|uniref:hypothetical protein n=1 Tax=Psychroserpens sp. Hel_I_66 TaxID=1250004 RepID=UPI000AF664D3|nr:hypothetical protein [Psychroserpens sp. Hel_I_66]